MIYSLCSSSFCQGRRGVVVVEKDTHSFFFFCLRDCLLHSFLQTAVPEFQLICLVGYCGVCVAVCSTVAVQAFWQDDSK